MSRRVDAIVVGAGLGGAIAARELQHRGLRTVVLEARDRVGGRAYTPLVRGERTDLGGQNIYWSEPFIWAEVSRYRLDVMPTPAYDTYAVRDGDRQYRYSAAEGFGQMVSGLTNFNGDYPKAFPQPYRPTLLQRDVDAFDGLSVQDRLNTIDLSADQLRWLKPYFGMLSGGDPTQASLAWMVFLTAWAGGVPEMLRTRSAFRVTNGMQALVEVILSDSGAEVITGTPVRSVHDQGDVVMVTTADGEVLVADAVVVATSGNTVATIAFPAGLSDSKTDTTHAGTQTPNAFHKLFALVDGPLDGVYVQRTDYEQHPLIHVRRDLRRADGLTQAIGFSVDPTFDDADTSGNADLFADMLDIPASRIVDVIAYDWVADPWSRGGTAFVRPGRYARLDELLAPEGRVVFAVSDFQYGGYNAAVERGIVAASDVLRIRAGAASAMLAASAAR